jgi:hypothetical protein
LRNCSGYFDVPDTRTSFPRLLPGYRVSGQQGASAPAATPAVVAEDNPVLLEFAAGWQAVTATATRAAVASRVSRASLMCTGTRPAFPLK